MPLEREHEVYDRRRPELHQRYRGLFVLIKDDDLVGVYPDAEAAFREGVTRFGMVPFLVRQVLDHGPIGVAPIFSLTLPHAPDAC
jgi:hypothetical protein